MSFLPYSPLPADTLVDTDFKFGSDASEDQAALAENGADGQHFVQASYSPVIDPAAQQTAAQFLQHEQQQLQARQQITNALQAVAEFVLVKGNPLTVHEWGIIRALAAYEMKSEAEETKPYTGPRTTCAYCSARHKSCAQKLGKHCAFADTKPQSRKRAKKGSEKESE